MHGIVVVTGVKQLPPAERWPRFVAPLAAELASSGLGSLLDLDALRQQAEQDGAGLIEVAVDLVNLDYGRQLIDRVAERAGLRRDAATMPKRWREFGSADYFRSPLAEQGYWNEPSQCWDVWPAKEIYERADLPFLVIGGPGTDGIEWGYRAGHTGVWAYLPIDDEFVWLAPTAEALLQGWLSGAIAI
jgi:hypothetical protein